MREHGTGNTRQERFNSALVAWSGRWTDLPGRQVLLDAHFKEFGAVPGVNDRTIRVIARIRLSKNKGGRPRST
jgi:hypothetical protein